MADWPSRIGTDLVEADLDRSFADGGDESGARAEKFADAAKRAQSLSKIAVKNLDLQ